ncbi:MAG: response regulator [Planctomycetota bacterium]
MTATDPMQSSDNPQVAASPTVYVIDDEVSILNVVRRVCAGIDVDVRTFADARVFLDAVTPETAGCIVLDYILGDTDGFQVLRELRDSNVQMPVIFISGQADIPTAVQAMQLGSLHFLEKPFDPQQLTVEVQKALARDAENRERRRILNQIEQRIDSLTKREKEVAELVIAGNPNKVTADRLGVSPKTIEVHRAAVMRKMGATSLAELVQFWLYHQNEGDTGEAPPNLGEQLA